MSEKFRVFISYSPDDLHYADQLATGLRAGGIDPTIDRQGISSGEDRPPPEQPHSRCRYGRVRALAVVRALRALHLGG